MTYQGRAEKLAQMIGMGQLDEALDELYDDNVVIVEANGDTFETKAKQKERVVEWQNGLEAMHGGGVYAITSNEDAAVTMIESYVEVTFKGAPGPYKFEEVAVQNWKDGKIVKERFYYNAPGM